MSNTRVDVCIDGARATITLSTDNGINVLSSAVLEKLRSAIATVGEAGGVRCAVVRAEGKVFVAGADIKEMQHYDREQALAYAAFGQEVLDALALLPCITVAAINGAAMGGGLELALACDFRVAAVGAKLALPEVTLGLIPGWSGMKRLVRLVGLARAKRLFLSGNVITGADAHLIGLVDEVADSVEALVGVVDAFCQSFVRAAPAAVRLAKRALVDGDDRSGFGDCFETDDAREGIAAFVEKRKATWAK